MLKDKLIGCGYCELEKTCSMHNPKINKAKLGCKEYKPIDFLPKIKIPLKFRGIDDFNRPVFKQEGHRVYYGSTTTLFSGIDDPEVISEYFRKNISELEYFGSSFNCEPMGGKIDRHVLIIK